MGLPLGLNHLPRKYRSTLEGRDLSGRAIHQRRRIVIALPSRSLKLLVSNFSSFDRKVGCVKMRSNSSLFKPFSQSGLFQSRRQNPEGWYSGRAAPSSRSMTGSVGALDQVWQIHDHAEHLARRPEDALILYQTVRFTGSISIFACSDKHIS